MQISYLAVLDREIGVLKQRASSTAASRRVECRDEYTSEARGGNTNSDEIIKRFQLKQHKRRRVHPAVPAMVVIFSVCAAMTCTGVLILHIVNMKGKRAGSLSSQSVCHVIVRRGTANRHLI